MACYRDSFTLLVAWILLRSVGTELSSWLTHYGISLKVAGFILDEVTDYRHAFLP
jgi:hypothetical protein